MNLRRPRAAVTSTAIPALGALLATGCHDPVCGESRGVELETHAPTIRRAIASGDPQEALRQMAIAMGLVAHDGSTMPGRSLGGAIAIPTAIPPTPPPVVESNDADGQMTAVTPQPRSHDPTNTARRPGDIQRTHVSRGVNR